MKKMVALFFSVSSLKTFVFFLCVCVFPVSYVRYVIKKCGRVIREKSTT